MKKILVSTLLSLSLLSACGADNVAACKAWKDKVKCGSSSAQLDSAINCDAYASATCDISEYFNCLSTAYVCTNGMYDTTKLGNVSGCASKAVCK